MARPPAKGADNESDELLDDLESIRTLLDEPDADNEPAAAQASSGASGDEVPMLDDVVDLEEAEQERSPGNLTEDVFNSLLGDGWKEAADDLLDDARQAIDEQAHKWTPEDTDELNEALRVRIDDTIYNWLQNMLANNIDALRSQVLDAMSDEIHVRVKQAFGDASQTATGNNSRGRYRDSDSTKD